MLLNVIYICVGLGYVFMFISFIDLCKEIYYYKKQKKEYFYKNVRVFSNLEHISKNLEALTKAPKFMNWIDKIIEAGEFKITAFEVTDIPICLIGVISAVVIERTYSSRAFTRISSKIL